MHDNKNLTNLISALKDFKKSYKALEEAIESLPNEIDPNQFISKGYPFEKSFDEYAGIYEWVDDAVLSIEKWRKQL